MSNGTWWARFDRIMERAEAIVLMTIMFILFVLVTLQVLARLSDEPPTWTEEVSRYLMVWLTFFGAAVCIRYNEHVGFTLLAESLGGKSGDVLRRLAQLATFVLMIVLFIQGALWVRTVIASGQTMITFELPIYWVGLALPVAGLIGAIHSIQRLLSPSPANEQSTSKEME
ncbi:MAG: TRAP transporter small permease [Rhizobiales bacterium]|nr:TRAP transporter small permease [Hyphomicrobiales bacterium]